MPYVGPLLEDAFDPGPAERAAFRIADEMGETGHSKAADFTPVDSGNLRTAWYREPTRRRRRAGGVEYVTVVANDEEYAEHVEDGTGIWGPTGTAYEITPKQPGGVLSWITRKPFLDRRTGEVVPIGTRVYARRVMHPGSRGRHMMARAAAYVDASLDLIAAPVLEEWEREQEAAFRNARRVVR